MHPHLKSTWPASAAMLVLLTAAPAVAPQTRTEQEARAWVLILRQHVPGRLDEHVQAAARRPWGSLKPVFDELRGWGEPVVLLRTAALLTDIAFLVPRTERPVDPKSGTAFVAQDGRARGTTPLDSHLRWARQLVDRAEPLTAEDSTIRAHAIAWYRTVSSMLASDHNLADWEPHVEASLRRFPNDAGIQFDAGCYAETFAAPMMQAPLATLDERPSHLKPHEIVENASRSPGILLADAEKRFRRAVQIDPAMTEARVRLGRVLTLRGTPAEAVEQLRQSLDDPADVTVQYFARLFLGRALEGTGDSAAAMQSYRSAAALFPEAQSPKLSISHLAARRGDSAASRAAVEQLLASRIGSADRTDPWWIYIRSSGRNARAIYGEFASRMASLPIPAEPARKIR